MAQSDKKTSPEVAKKAAQELHSKDNSATAKSVAASALSQSKKKLILPRRAPFISHSD